MEDCVEVKPAHVLAHKNAAQQTVVPILLHVSGFFVFDLYIVVGKGCGCPNHPSQKLMHKVHKYVPYTCLF